MIQLNCKDIHRRMVRTQKNSRTVGIQANVCSKCELLKESCHRRTLRTQWNFQDNFRTYKNCQEYISQKTGVFSEYQDAAELSGCSRTMRMQQNCQDAAELSGCSRTVRMQQNCQDAAELSGCSRTACSRTVGMKQNCQNAPEQPGCTRTVRM
jgi:hypothetical protein